MKLPHLFVTLLTFLPAAVFSADLEFGPESPQWEMLYRPAFKKPQEIPVGDPVRKELFDLLRPKIEKKAKQPVLFQGGLFAFRNWALFQGDTLDKNEKPIAFPGLGNSDTVALWLHTADGWKLVDYEAGHSDVFYMIWIEKYGMPRQLLFRNAK